MNKAGRIPWLRASRGAHKPGHTTTSSDPAARVMRRDAPVKYPGESLPCARRKLGITHHARTLVVTRSAHSFARSYKATARGWRIMLGSDPRWQAVQQGNG